jgi:Tfp pilus assembly protein PilP
MKKMFILLFCAGFLSVGSSLLFSQEQKKLPEREAILDLQSTLPTYDPAGKRDPFKNLLAGKELKEKTTPGGLPQLFIDDTTLIGIVKHKNKFTAIVSGPSGFPYYLEVGDKLTDGFILSINDSQVVFRKTNERGIPLTKPKDTVKEIKPEER